MFGHIVQDVGGPLPGANSTAASDGATEMTDTAAGRDERLSRLSAAMAGRGLSALVCVRNLDVLLVSGFWPVVGDAVAIVTAEPQVWLVVPEDTRELAERGWADRVHTY